VCEAHVLAAKPCFSAFKVSAKNGLFLGQMTRVKLVFLEAPLRPVEQPDKRTPRGTSGLGAYHHGCVSDLIKAFTSGWKITFVTTQE
jgi:hypothetical protein